MTKRIFTVTIVLFFYSTICGQQTADTASLLKEFTRVMAFTSVPYLYYTTTTTINSEPVLTSVDTLSINGEFYKNDTEIYSGSPREEVYLQDSLLVEVNNERKSISLRRVDVLTKVNLNVLPVATDEMLARFMKQYVISKSVLRPGIGRLYFEERKPSYSTAVTTTSITIEYSEKDYLPKLIEIVVLLKQPADESVMEALKAEEIDGSKLVKQIDGAAMLIRKQKVSIVFNHIQQDKGKFMQMPSYRSVVDYDEGSQEFAGKGRYKEYEVTKMF